MQFNNVLETISRGLPGLVVPLGDQAQWVTEAGRCVQLAVRGDMLSVKWPVFTDHRARTEHKIEDPGETIVDLINGADGCSFDDAFTPLDEIQGQIFKLLGVRRAQNSSSIICRVALHGNRLASWELKYTMNSIVQVRRIGAVFRRHHGVSLPMVADLWGSEHEMERWLCTRALAYAEDPDSLQHTG